VRSILLALALAAVPVASGAQALFDAVRAGDHQAVRALIAKKANVNATQVDGSTPLHLALDAGADEIARLLLAAGANASTPTRYGVTPLGLAARNGNAKLI